MKYAQVIRSHAAGSVLIPALAAVVALACTACGSSSGSSSSNASGTSKKLTTITVAASSSNLLGMPIYVGQKDGYYSRAGLNVKYVLLTAATTGTSLQSGSVQFLNENPSAFLEALSTGAPQVAVGQDAIGLPFGFVIGKKFASSHNITASTPLTTVAHDLIGSKGGSTSASTTGEEGLFLREYGVQPSQVKIATLSDPPAMQAALEAGEIDWFATGEPTPLQIQAAGQGIVVATPDNVPAWAPKKAGISQAIVTTKQYAKSNASIVKKFVDATAQATDYIRAHSSDVLDVASAEFPSTPAALLKESYTQVVWPSTAAMTTALWNTTINFTISQGVLASGTKLASDDWTNQYAS